jgi:hypothetical protein
MRTFDLPSPTGEHQVNGYDSIIGTHSLTSLYLIHRTPEATPQVRGHDKALEPCMVPGIAP